MTLNGNRRTAMTNLSNRSPAGGARRPAPRNASAASATAPGRTPYVDEKIAAEYLGVSVRFLREDRLGDRLVPFYRIKRLVRYRLDEIDAQLVATCHRGPTVQSGPLPPTRRAALPESYAAA